MKMKYIVSLLMSVMLFTSCDKWLDVKSDLDIYETDLFEGANGYYAVLNGIYMKMGGTSLYGRELTLGAVEAWSRTYVLTEENHRNYYNIANFDYTTSEARTIADNIWLSAFNVVAEANNLIQGLEKDTEVQFPDGEVCRDMILGEAYAIRALMHFEMVRIFAQAPVVDGGASATVPYVTVFPSRANTPLPTKEVLAKITDDLELAKTLIAPMDTVPENMGAKSFNGSVDRRLLLGAEFGAEVDDDFYKYRAHRLNYWAVTQLLARVYLYAGDYDNAYRNANEIVEMVESGLIYSFTAPGLICCPLYISEAEPRLHKEMLLGLYQNNFSENNDNYISPITNSYLAVADIADIFEDNMADVRYTGGFYNTQLVKYMWDVDEDQGGNVDLMSYVKNIIPVLRFPECYYIAAESIFDKDPARAVEIFNMAVDARNNQALELSLGVSKEEFLDAIVSEYRREFIGEGYLVYVYKRLNIPIRSNGIEVNHNQQLVMPLPDNETLY